MQGIGRPKLFISAEKRMAYIIPNINGQDFSLPLWDLDFKIKLIFLFTNTKTCYIIITDKRDSYRYFGPGFRVPTKRKFANERIC